MSQRIRKVDVFIMTGPKTILHYHLIFRRQGLRVKVDEILPTVREAAKLRSLIARNIPV